MLVQKEVFALHVSLALFDTEQIISKLMLSISQSNERYHRYICIPRQTQTPIKPTPNPFGVRGGGTSFCA